MDDAYTKSLEFAHIKSARVISYHKKGGLFDNILMGPSNPLELSHLAGILMGNETSQFMYLWSPVAAMK